MASGARARFFARMLHLNALLEHIVEQRDALLSFERLALWAELGMRKNDDLRHDRYVSASTRLPASAPRTLRSMRRAAKSAVV